MKEGSVKRRTRGKGEGTNEIDALVGQRLRELRMLAGLSQSDLAATIGLTFQQLQKYERGVNRISASKLYLLARYLNVPVSALFADLEGQRAEAGAQAPVVSEIEPATAEAGDGQMRSREALVLARHFMRIRDPNARAALKAFAEACAGISAGTDQSEAVDAEAGELEDEVSSSQPRRYRRPRGAVWHPTDIEQS
jgi:transcriptional regulator with XRE-family HTH domain